MDRQGQGKRDKLFHHTYVLSKINLLYNNIGENLTHTWDRLFLHVDGLRFYPHLLYIYIYIYVCVYVYVYVYVYVCVCARACVLFFLI